MAAPGGNDQLRSLEITVATLLHAVKEFYDQYEAQVEDLKERVRRLEESPRGTDH